MKLYVKLVVAVAIVAGATTLPAVEVDGIAAKVGADNILKSEVMMELRRMRLPDNEYPRVLQDLIDRRLIVKAAGEAKMTMQEWVIEGRIRDIITKSFGGDRNKLMETLSAQKVSYPEWHQRMKEDMIVSAMRWNVIDKNAVVSPSALRKEFNDHRDRYDKPAKVTLSVILLNPESITNRVTISSLLRERDFEDLAKEYSADIHAAEGGIWKEIVPGDVFKPEICAEIAKMPKGTISHWIELDGWSYLLKKIDEIESVRVTFADAYEAIEGNLREEMARKAYDDWLARLREETFIKIY